jgi:hypothetical protein
MQFLFVFLALKFRLLGSQGEVVVHGGGCLFLEDSTEDLEISKLEDCSQ